MNGVARLFFTLAIIYALLGMALGLHMAISQDHGQMVTHAHIMLAGFLSSIVFAFFYNLYPTVNHSGVARAHFWLQAASSVLMLVSLYFFYGGNEAAEPGAAIGSIAFLLGVVLFGWISLRTVWGGTAA